MSRFRALREWIPPKLLPLARQLASLRRAEWSYVGQAWVEGPAGEGWIHPSIIGVETERWNRFVDAVRTTGSLGLNHEAPEIHRDDLAIHNVVMSFLYVAALASRGRSTLRVLDWGGGIGHYYLFARAGLPDVLLDYTCKDLPPFCEAGRKLLPEVHFETDDDRALGRMYDLVMASSSLWYAQEWKTLLRRLSAATDEYCYVTRMVFVNEAPSFVVQQRPESVGYLTQYATWILNRSEMLAAAQVAGLELVREFFLGPGPYIRKAPEQGTFGGFLFRKARGPQR